MIRPLGPAGLRAYLREIRPRVLVLHVRARGHRFGWAMPSWALEEPLRCLLRLGPVAAALAPTSVRHWMGRLGIAADVGGGGPVSRGWWRAVDGLFSEAHRDLLALPPDTPLLDIDTRDVRIVLREIRL